ncbi:MAG TPA: ABC transporter substrate-binding protein, partial [Nitrospirales bacterium]|nr:ABC transporter substrate-binding protein [Nitrospirales bacterium]
MFRKLKIFVVMGRYSSVNAITVGAILGMGVLCWPGGVLGVEAPTVVVRGTIDEVIRLVSDEGLKKPDQEAHRRKLLEETIGQHFDFEEMAKRSLAAHWRNRSESEHQEFATLFQTLLSKTYAGKIE